MAKNIVVCSDGTGNAFAERATNVSELIKSIDLRCLPDQESPTQMAFYDQGVGTNSHLVKDAISYAKENPNGRMLCVLPEPQCARQVARYWARLRGLVSGYGLDLNVKEMVRALSDVYEYGDKVFLFGFSRGAFTVRAVAGFLHRCGLPTQGQWFERWFGDAFELYREFLVPKEHIETFRKRSRPIDIEFLGLWDTVKSYGGVNPVSWPHLRHNPSVRVVRHALALHEQRAWFEHTTWGRTDEKLHGAPLEPDSRYGKQDVQEVWFRGCHSDVGGGNREHCSARVSLLWMLGEAANFGLRLNSIGLDRFECEADFNRRVEVHDSFQWWWPIVGMIRRQVLHNEWRPPQRTSVRGSRSVRDPLKPELLSSKPRLVQVHASALSDVHLPNVQKVNTRRPPTQGGSG